MLKPWIDPYIVWCRSKISEHITQQKFAKRPRPIKRFCGSPPSIPAKQILCHDWYWKDTPSSPAGKKTAAILQMNVHLFGKLDSRCCCIWTLHKTTPDNVVTIIDRPEEAISNNLYIHDYLDSFHTKEVAMGILKDITGALKKWGFCLTKRISIDQHILDKLPSQEQSPTFATLDFDNLRNERALGILWNPNRDIPST